MDQPPRSNANLTEWLLLIATDKDEYDNFANDPQNYGTTTGFLTPGQVSVLERGDSREIMEAVMDELKGQSWAGNEPFKSILTIVLPMDHVQMFMPCDDEDE